jgi:hypothetical protein
MGITPVSSHDIRPSGKVRFVIGHETNGIRDIIHLFKNVKYTAVTIPQKNSAPNGRCNCPSMSVAGAVLEQISAIYATARTERNIYEYLFLNA